MIRGRAYKFGDNINTDDIFPGRYLSITTDRAEMARHCFENARPEFAATARAGDIIVAGRNFGCGSSREQAAACLKQFGIQLVAAESFARIFFRNAINLGLPVLGVPGITAAVGHLDPLEIDLEKGIIRSVNGARVLTAVPLPDFILSIIADGGLINNLRKRLKTGERL